MTRSSVRYAPAYLTCVFLLILVFGSFQPAQSIALSSLCGQFGHSCFGGNWGKRELPAASLETPLEFDQSTLDKENFLKDYYLDQFRSNLIRQRLQTLLEYE